MGSTRFPSCYIVVEASERGIPTVGIGDGSNEIGMGMCRMPLPGLFLLETRFARFRRRTCYYLAVYRTGALTRSRQPLLCWALSRLFPGVGKRHFRIHANGQCFALSCKAVVKPPVFASLGNEQIQPLLIGELMGLCPRICVARFDIG